MISYERLLSIYRRGISYSLIRTLIKLRLYGVHEKADIHTVARMESDVYVRRIEIQGDEHA